MRRSVLALVVVSALSILASAAVYADSMSGQNSPGWLKASMDGAWGGAISAAAQKEVGMTLDQLKADMGPTSLTESDGSGGTYYLYRVDIAAPNGWNVQNLWFDVDSSGKVAKVVS